MIRHYIDRITDCRLAPDASIASPDRNRYSLPVRGFQRLKRPRIPARRPRRPRREVPVIRTQNRADRSLSSALLFSRTMRPALLPGMMM